MARFETYCQKSFLDHFFDQWSNYQNNYDFTDPTTENLSFNQLRDLIFLKSDLLLDETNIESLALKNPFYKALVKNITSGGSRIYDFCSQFKTHTEKDSLLACSPSALHYFSYCSSDQIDKLYHKNGVFVNGKDCWDEKINFLSKARSFNVHSDRTINDFPGWQILSHQELPINSFIIVDQYLTEKGDLFETNLFQIIKNVLPDSLEDLPFHFSIITSRSGNSDDTFIQRKYDLIQDYISHFNKPYPIEFTIWLTDSKYTHNRWMISQYYYLKSEHSFNYFNSQGKITKETELTYFGINARPFKLYCNKLASLKQGLRNADVFGVGKNRLLE